MASGGFHNRLTEGDIRDKVAIHHVAVDPISARFRHALHLIPQATEVTGKDRGSDDGWALSWHVNRPEWLG
jgi:hypothetical protein